MKISISTGQISIGVIAIVLCVFSFFTLSDQHQLIGTELFTGVYTSEFEHSAFTGDKVPQNESWWVEFSPNVHQHDFIKTIQQELEHNLKSSFKVSFKGRITEKGRHGHMGMYDRELMVSEIISIICITQPQSSLPAGLTSPSTPPASPARTQQPTAAGPVK